MTLVDERGPRSSEEKSARSQADKRSAVLACVGWCFTLACILGLPGPDLFYMGAAPAIGAALVFPALLAMQLQRFRGGISRLLLVLAAVLVAGVGAAYLGRVGFARVLLGNFLPAVLFFAAAAALQAPRLRERAAV
jgi:hypothetical protein